MLYFGIFNIGQFVFLYGNKRWFPEEYKTANICLLLEQLIVFVWPNIRLQTISSLYLVVVFSGVPESGGWREPPLV